MTISSSSQPTNQVAHNLSKVFLDNESRLCSFLLSLLAFSQSAVYIFLNLIIGSFLKGHLPSSAITSIFLEDPLEALMFYLSEPKFAAMYCTCNHSMYFTHNYLVSLWEMKTSIT